MAIEWSCTFYNLAHTSVDLQGDFQSIQQRLPTALADMNSYQSLVSSTDPFSELSWEEGFHKLVKRIE